MAKTTTEKYCTTCGAHLVEPGYVQFPCPKCEVTIGRCVSCRKQSNLYTCPACGFTGP
ncbi:MAG: HVO_2753 family zinc finger protein [Candidatus Methanogasteraceae archaeon]|nr:HVO_2753 family zinc finger protein [Euryarchaeota archaeon]